MMRVLSDNILVKIINEEDQTSASGLIISAGSNNSAFQKAQIVGVGSGVTAKDISNKEALIARGSAAELIYEGDKYYVIKEESLVAVL